MCVCVCVCVCLSHVWYAAYKYMYVLHVCVRYHVFQRLLSVLPSNNACIYIHGESIHIAYRYKAIRSKATIDVHTHSFTHSLHIMYIVTHSLCIPQ